MDPDETDCEIEYLDEDAEIVQQCVKNTETAIDVLPNLVIQEKLTPLLVERVPVKKKKRKGEEDVDYDPRESLSTPVRKRKAPLTRARSQSRNPKLPINPPAYTTKQISVRIANPQVQRKQSESTRPAKNVTKLTPEVIIKKAANSYKKELLEKRRNLKIRIPDYEDPLCLPVRMLKTDIFDLKRLKNWNNLCLDHFRHCDTTLKPDNGKTKSSKRTVVFRNVKNSFTGKIETTIWGKTCVENDKGIRKSDIIQSVLPKYREKTVLNFKLLSQKYHKRIQMVNKMLITKEDTNNEETLVIYNPNEAISAVYKDADKETSKPVDNKTSNECQAKLENDNENDEDKKLCIREVACVKVCAPCYQASWRGNEKIHKKNMKCEICNRTFVSVYNLLAHTKTHRAEDVRKHKRLISKALAGMLEYHYKCRICQEHFISIKDLRQHVNTHQGTELYMCAIGNHMTK